ncbi:MAG: hypothetical protein PUP93_20585 [Rhizonema sp. NSF051]|nr:hypothetical protein [Rhizonema sp. NSF051]
MSGRATYTATPPTVTVTLPHRHTATPPTPSHRHTVTPPHRHTAYRHHSHTPTTDNKPHSPIPECPVSRFKQLAGYLSLRWLPGVSREKEGSSDGML